MAHILAVDDSRSIRKLVTLVLENEGHEVTNAVNGQEALDIVESNSSFDLIICDVNMPEMDGLTFVSSRSDKTTPVLMLTTEASREMKDKGRDAGVRAWLVKPFTPDKLRHAIHVLVGNAT